MFRLGHFQGREYEVICGDEERPDFIQLWDGRQFKVVSSRTRDHLEIGVLEVSELDTARIRAVRPFKAVRRRRGTIPSEYGY
jgi:hypothetical protein